MSRRLRAPVFAAMVWALVALPAWLLLFLGSSTDLVVAGHDTRISPNLGSHAVLRTGPYLPDLRVPVAGRFGVDVEVGKTTAQTTPQLVARYASIGSHPEAERREIERAVRNEAVDAAMRAAALGLVLPGLWWVVGVQRRREVLRALRRPKYAVLGAGAVAFGVLTVTTPWRAQPAAVQTDGWLPLSQAVPEIPLPVDLAGVEISGGVVTDQTRRLVASAVSTYEQSRTFYADIVDAVPDVADQLRRPAAGDVVGILVSDRHDNVGMDPVARAVGDAAGATVVLDAGDDTSTGATWERFSLDSLDRAFDGLDDRVFIAGNHDHGGFVADTLGSMGWTHLEGEPVRVAGIRMLGVDDPRSSGLGNWRDESGLSFAEVRDRLSAELCRLDEDGERIATVVVHDRNMALPAVERGCVDLVVGGHIHVQQGPDRFDGEAGTSWTYTNGTTGGAAYAIAVGSKLRREAEVTLITWRDGRPIGLQPVRISTTGELSVDPWVPLPR